MLDKINAIMWAVVTALILLSSIYFTSKLKLVQFNFKQMFINLFNKNVTKNGITPIQSLMMTLGARIGVGSIAGVVLAIYLGGPGSLFWMWITAMLAATNSFAETVLGIRYQSTSDGMKQGGPSYYIEKGLKKRKLGGLYAIIVLFSYVGGYVSIQANTITKSVQTFINVPSFIIGLVICFFTISIIYGGLKKIASFIEKMVPLMTFFYLAIGLFVMIKNITVIPNLFGYIIKDAFSFKASTAGILGGIIIGVQRAIFSNEAGIGTCTISSSAADVKSAAGQGYLQMIGIYVTTFLVCTSTAIILLTSDYGNVSLTDINGIELAQYAFKYHLGNVGSILLFVSILLFSFSSILTGYYDGESCLRYLLKKIKPLYINILKIASLLVLFIGSVTSPTTIWNFVDIFTAFLAFINIYALLKLKDVVIYEYKYYKNVKCGKK